MTAPEASLHHTLMSDPCELAGTRDVVRAWLTAAGWNGADIADVELAVDEALSNVIRHGYGNQRGHQIELKMSWDGPPGHPSELIVEIRDWAAQVPLDKIRGRDLDDLRPGGLGVHIIQQVMDTAEYSHADGGGMRLVMRKKPQPNRCD